MDSQVAASRALNTAVLKLLRPLCRLLLRNHVPFAAFEEMAKHVYVQTALEDFGIPGKKPTLSRASILTGLTRKDVQRIVAEPEPLASTPDDGYNRAARVLTGWARDPDFHGPNGKPAPLHPSEGEASFAALVRRYSGDMPVRAVLDELLRVGAVRMRGGEVELLQRHYIPPLGDERKLVYLGDDAADLIATIGHNLGAQAGETRFQRKVFYDNVPAESLPEVRRVARERGERLLDELARELSRHDRDVNPARGGTGRMRIAVGIYFAEEPFGAEPNRAPQPSGARSRRTAGAASGNVPRRIPRKRNDP